ncbi:MAG: DUF2652 domain-containing protein [Thermoleophilia bacterium]|nr:DUF2652 domain-containing protein [Thermoleophilia bacterium]
MTNPDTAPQEGYLLLADISGYTEFLTGTELEHSHAIIRELTRLIRERLTPPMRFVKLEGDAVFCYAGSDAFRDGERFVELIESCYFGFADRLLDMERGTTCSCDACAAIPSLGLKFVAHYGSFIVECDDGSEDLAGPDVILVHRLLKNRITEGGGPAAYAFFTEACRQRLPEDFELADHRETYGSFGEVAGGVYDLNAALQQMRENRREYVGPADADLEVNIRMQFPAEIVWQYFVDPDKRLRWQPFQTGVENRPNTGGRMGVGAASHCAHGDAGDALREYLDWRPFTYFTNRFTPLPNGPEIMPLSTETVEFTSQEDGGTSVSWRIRLEDRGEKALSRFEVVRQQLESNLPTLWEAALSKALDDDGRRRSRAR